MLIHIYLTSDYVTALIVQWLEHPLPIPKNLCVIILSTIHLSPKIWAENLNSFGRPKIWAQILRKMNNIPLKYRLDICLHL